MFGQMYSQALEKMGVGLSNEGTISSSRWNDRDSVIGVTFRSSLLVANFNWRVCVGYTHSDLQAIRYSIGRQWNDVLSTLLLARRSEIQN